MTPDPRPTAEAPDDDPRLWLEEIDGAEALAWVAAQNETTLAAFGDARFEADRDVLAELFGRPDNLPVIARRGRHIYNYWTDGSNPRGLWRRTSLASFRSETPEWELVLDLDALAAEEGEDWVWG